MIIASGHLVVAAEDRDSYLDDCREVVTAGRAAPGCLDFALSPDVVDARRINILERCLDDAVSDTSWCRHDSVRRPVAAR